jgi:hypothetical protein
MLYLFAFLLPLFFMLSCASTGSAATEPAAIEETDSGDHNSSLARVYNAYRQDIVLDGATTYKVVKGDTLSAITRKHFGAGNGYYFPLIMLASSDVVVDPDLIEPNMELTIPSLQKNLEDPASHKRIKSFLADIADIYDRKGDIKTRDGLLKLADTL